MCWTLRPSSVVPLGLRDGKDSGHVMPQVARTCDEEKSDLEL